MWWERPKSRVNKGPKKREAAKFYTERRYHDQSIGVLVMYAFKQVPGKHFAADRAPSTPRDKWKKKRGRRCFDFSPDLALPSGNNSPLTDIAIPSNSSKCFSSK
ncbi:hypothetical protein BY996DRAFT_6488601 [Phakopsora pachyrhizi]|nr:hypothetical protein BY996DRAFT_6488601 [Phakopsora pachyrhizi]